MTQASPDSGPTANPDPQPPQGPPSLYERSAPFFDSIRGWGIVRSEHRWVGGVAGGLARRLGIDPMLARGLVVVVELVTGVGFVLYGLAWLFLPQSDGRIHAQEILRGRFSAGFLGGVIFIFLNVGSANNNHWSPGGRGTWPGGLVLIAVAVGLALWYGNQRKPSRGGGTTPSASQQPYSSPSQQAYSPPQQPYSPAQHPYSAPQQPYGAPQQAYYPPPRRVDTARPSHALTLVTLGLAALAVVTVVLWNASTTALTGGPSVLAIGAALGVLAVGIVVAGLLGRRAGALAPLGVLLAVCLFVASAAAPWKDVRGTTETVVVSTAHQAQTPQDLSAGELVLDLTSPGLLSGATTASPVTVRSHVGLGRIEVRLPAGQAVEVHAKASLGAISEQGTPQQDSTQQDRGGTNIEQTLTYGTGKPVLVVYAEVGVGEIRVVTAEVAP